MSGRRWQGIGLPGLLAMVMLAAAGPTAAQEHHDHGVQHVEPAAKPGIFLDKSPRVVAYQLKRLSNQRLLLVDRMTTDAKYAAVYEAILLRAGMSPQYRQEAIEALATIHQSHATKVVIDALESLDADDRQESRTAKELAALLLGADPASLAASVDDFTLATQSQNPLVRLIGYAGFIASMQGQRAVTLADQQSADLDFLRAVSIVPLAKARNSLLSRLISFLSPDYPRDVRKAAITSLQSITVGRADTFRLLAQFVDQPDLRSAAVKSLLTVPDHQRDPTISASVLTQLVQLAESTPADLRTTDDFLDAMQLADQLLARVPVKQARSLRQRLRDVTVRVVVLHTVEEEMRYDRAFFAVEAGRPVQVVLKNEDLMPHNLVLVTPGSLQEVAELGLAAGPQGFQGKGYVPKSEQVLFATHMVQPAQQERLTFTAPTEPGEYPYVCTFPRHWVRMYGVMVVVEDMDTWLKNPVEPKDPIGSNRPFVKSWQMDDLGHDVDQGVRGRSLEIGKRLFSEATCAQCHKAEGVGGAVGPDLKDVFARFKSDRIALLREILEPSHRIDPQYAVHLLMTLEGTTISGIVAKEDKKSVSLLANPESDVLTVVNRDEIDEMVKTSTSMMPKGLLDRFTKDEIFELLAFLESLR